MKFTSATVFIAAALIAKIAIAAPEQSLVVNSKTDNTWFNEVKADFRANPEKMGEIFKNLLNENDFDVDEIKSAISSSSLLDANSKNLEDQKFGALIAKFSNFDSKNLVSSSAAASNEDVISEIVSTIVLIDSDLSSDSFSAMSSFEEEETEKTRGLIKELKLRFKEFKGNSQVDSTVLSSFITSKLSELKNLKQQSKKFGLGYRSSLKFWISQTLSTLSTIEDFEMPKDTSLFFRENSDLISYSLDDQDFIGELLGEMIIAKISGDMEAGNHEVAAQGIADVLMDLTAYSAILSGAIGLCYWLGSLPVGPAACTLGIAVVSISTVLLAIRTFRNLL
ncbi:hypothetical protein ACO0SA_004399 [Hanseniaspora valbyensis]